MKLFSKFQRQSKKKITHRVGWFFAFVLISCLVTGVGFAAFSVIESSRLLLVPDDDTPPNYTPVAFLTQGSAVDIEYDVTDGGLPLTGSHRVTAELFPMEDLSGNKSEVTEVIVNGVSVTDGAGAVEIFNAYDFTASGGVLSVPALPIAGEYGQAWLQINIEAGAGQYTDVVIDTGLSEPQNFDDHRYAEDSFGGLTDFNKEGIYGVNVQDTRMTGYIWSDSYGWIDLQPVGGGVSLDLVSQTRANLIGLGYNDNLGYINFGPQNGLGGVFIDQEGYLHGTAWNESLGAFAFGGYMHLNPDKSIDSSAVTGTIHEATNWAKTSWTFPVNDEPTIALVDPSDSASFADREPTFTFHIEDPNRDRGYGNLVGYTIQLSRRGSNGLFQPYRAYTTPGATLTPNLTGEDFTYQFPAALEAGEYQWQMWAFDDLNDWSEASSTWTFTITSNPPTTNLIYPNDDSGIIDVPTRQPTFDFEISDGDPEDYVRYMVQISTVSDFSVVLPQSSAYSSYIDLDDASLADCTLNPVSPTCAKIYYTPSTNLPAGTLYWRVLYDDQTSGTLGAGAFEAFNITNVAPTIIATDVTLRDNANAIIPDQGTTTDTSPTLQWTVNDSDHETTVSSIQVVELVNIGDVPDFTDPKVFETTLNHQVGTQQRRTFSILESDKNYAYRIRATDGDGDHSAWISGAFRIGPIDRHGNVGTAAIKDIKPLAVQELDDVPDRNGNTPGYPDDPLDKETTDNKFAWNNTVGWIDMNPINGGVVVKSANLQGYAWNDSLGWIRMNCGAFDADIGIVDATGPPGAPIGDECGTYDYGVTNNNGTLSGTARIESTGKYIHFDGDFDNDGAVDNTDVGVTIGCTEATDGHFFGRAWAEDIGWIVFGRAEFTGDLGVDSDYAQGIFPITEWSCASDDNPELEGINRYRVFSARDESYSYAIADRNPSPYAADLICENSGVNGTDIDVERITINGDGSISAVDLDRSNQFSISCDNPNTPEIETDGKLWLTIEDFGGNATSPTRAVGLYRITGTVGDAGNNTTAFPENTETPHEFDNEYIFQVVADEPVLDPTTDAGLITETKKDTPQGVFANQFESLIADGDDTLTQTIEISDRFGNPVATEYQYHDTGGTQIKTVNLRAVYFDNVMLDQVSRSSISTNEAVTFTSIQKDSTAPTYETDHVYPTVQFATEGLTDPTIRVDMSTIAPTSNIDLLQLDRLEVSVLQTMPSATPLEVGQTTTLQDPLYENNTKVQKLGLGNIKFDSIISGVIIDKTQFETLVIGNQAYVDIALTNNSNRTNIDVDDYAWMGLARTIMPGGIDGDISFTNSNLQDNLTGNPVSTTSSPLGYYEGASLLSSYIAGGATNFRALLENRIGAGTYELFDKLAHFDALDVPGSGNETVEFRFATTPANPDALPDPEGYPQFSHYMAVNIDGEIVKYLLGITTSANEITDITMSISGTAHGEAYNNAVIVGENDQVIEFSELGQIYSRRDVRQIMYRNYQDIVGIREPVANSGFGGDEVEIIEDYNELNTLRGMDESTSARSLQGGKVVWFERDELSDTLSVVLGKPVGTAGPNEWDPLTDYEMAGSFTLPDPDPDPDSNATDTVTLLVRGGNLYIRNNIYLDDDVNLGIIMLKSRDSNKWDQEGNIFIHPEVTNIEAVIYAEGSIMSAIDDSGDGVIQENEIFDGFTGNTTTFANQLLIKGSIVSQNTAGTSGDHIIPEGVWLPAEWMLEDCDTEGADCTETVLSNIAKRYDLSRIRSFIVGRKFDSADDDLDGVKNSLECVGVNNPHDGKCVEDTANPGEFINTDCQSVANGTANAICAPIVDGVGTDAGRCAVGGAWCNNPAANPFFVDCGTSPDLCDSDGDLENRKLGASLVVEYDSLVQELTPVGMGVTADVTFD
jgi:hypothetical protein